MNDILPGEVARWQRLESSFRATAALHGYAELRTPLLEPTQLFARSIGESTDVVQKEMYTFERGRESLTLRPEGTASAVRAYIEHKVYAQQPVTRWFYLGPMYRAERPQRGRYREFYQAGVEVFGDAGPVCDAEIIAMLFQLFGQLGIGELSVKVNSLGSDDTRERYREALLRYLRPKADELSEVSRGRLEQNPLRVLDSKDPADRQASKQAPQLLDYLSEDDQAHFSELKECLTSLGVPFSVEPSLVRGLDYYTRSLFEITSEAGELGAQNALVGGGRYDGLVETLGGPATPGIGFAMGLERILLAMDDSVAPAPRVCFIAPLGAAAARAGLVLAGRLRQRGVVVELDGRGNSLKSMLRRADSSGAELALVLGDAEIEQGVVQVKSLRGQRAAKQQTLPQARALDVVAAELGTESK